MNSLITCLKPLSAYLIPRAVSIPAYALHLTLCDSLGIYFSTSAPGIFEGFSSWEPSSLNKFLQFSEGASSEVIALLFFCF